MRDRVVKNERPWWSLVLSGSAHLVGVLTLALVSLWWEFRGVSADLLLWAEARGYSFGEQNAMELAFHVAMCALAWFFGAFVVHHGRQARRIKRVRLARARRGSVMVETLIALPVMLVLICGLVQMTLLNIAAIMTDLAAIQAGRTAYVWHGETLLPQERSDGYSIPDQGDVRERARIVASGVLASIAPGTFSSGCSSSSAFNSYMAGITSVSSLSGAVAGNMGAAVGLSGKRATRNNRTLSESFDKLSFDVRGMRKLATAYCMTSIEYEVGDTLSTTVTYNHKLTVPITGFAFSTTFVGLGERATQIQRTYVLPAPGIEPNPYPPITLMRAIYNLNPFK